MIYKSSSRGMGVGGPARLWDHLLGIPVRSLSALEVVLLLIASMHTTCGTRGGNLHLLKTISGAV